MTTRSQARVITVGEMGLQVSAPAGVELDDVFGGGSGPAKSGDDFFVEAPECALEAATGRSGTGTMHRAH